MVRYIIAHDDFEIFFLLLFTKRFFLHPRAVRCHLCLQIDRLKLNIQGGGYFNFCYTTEITSIVFPPKLTFMGSGTEAGEVNKAPRDIPLFELRVVKQAP